MSRRDTVKHAPSFKHLADSERNMAERYDRIAAQLAPVDTAREAQAKRMAEQCRELAAQFDVMEF